MEKINRILNGYLVQFSIGLALVLIVAGTVGCNTSLPVESLNLEECRVELSQCMRSEDAGWDYSDETTCESQPAVVVTIDADESCKLLATQWENEAYRIGEALELSTEQRMGIEKKYDDLEDVLWTLDRSVVDYNCRVGNWEKWICEYMGYVSEAVE